MARNPDHSIHYQKQLQKPLAFNFHEKMKSALAQKHIGKALIGTIALKAVSDFFQSQHKIFGDIEGYIKHNTLFLKTTNQSLKIESFRQQTELLSYINKRLTASSYTHSIKKILFAK